MPLISETRHTHNHIAYIVYCRFRGEMQFSAQGVIQIILLLRGRKKRRPSSCVVCRVSAQEQELGFGVARSAERFSLPPPLSSAASSKGLRKHRVVAFFGTRGVTRFFFSLFFFVLPEQQKQRKRSHSCFLVSPTPTSQHSIPRPTHISMYPVCHGGDFFPSATVNTCRSQGQPRQPRFLGPLLSGARPPYRRPLKIAH
jgi:hypothetical protein